MGRIPDVRTGVIALDEMLGGGFFSNSLVLLRGGPGSGKTTLSLQIAANLLNENLKIQDGPIVVYACLESDPKSVIDAMDDSFGFNLNYWHEQGRLVLIDEQQLWQVKSIRSSASKLQDQPRDELKRCIDGAIKGLNYTNVLLILDSLIPLMSFLESDTVEEPLTSRRTLSKFCNKIRHNVDSRMTVIMIAEALERQIYSPSVLAESFLADVSIILKPEPIRVVGKLKQSGGEETRRYALEVGRSRFFCRVLKARGAHRQVRRCCYDFVSGKGIEFFQTFPGDGRIILFHENKPQRAEVNAFFTRDLFFAYPALEYDSFDRSGLQRTFAARRRAEHIPERTSCFTASYDEYWLKFYKDLRDRRDVARLVQNCLLSGVVDENARDMFSAILVTKIMKVFPSDVANLRITAADCREYRKRIGDNTIVEPDVNAAVEKINALIPKFIARINEELKNLREHRYRALEFLHPAGLFEVLPKDRLRLYGEIQSEFVEEIRRKEIFVPRLGDTLNLCAVPYMLNIGFMIRRSEKVMELAGRKEFRNRLAATVEEQRAVVEEAYRAVGIDGATSVDAMKISDEEMDRIQDRLCAGNPPATWEEITALCRTQGDLHGEEVKEGRIGQVLLETRTYDTLLATLLEFLWNNGGSLKVNQTYEIENPAETGLRLILAFEMLRRLFNEGIVPKHSTVNVSKKSSGEDVGRPYIYNPDRWLFARHWYSTYIDLITSDGLPASVTDVMRREDLGVMPIPVSWLYYKEQTRAGKDKIEHHSCWGEWYLAVSRGSENLHLGLDLINNLMSSSKVCERAFSGAGLPSVEEFYRTYGDVPCFSLPGREGTPSTTFNEIRKEYYGTARSRTEIYDYRHVMRELHAILCEVIHAPAECSLGKLEARVKQAIERISGLVNAPVLLH